ncbi:MAG: hypothetical protein JW910_01795 [Anaerolineae bacterium]|nr:hypothetical protein [Anaerolineae bacterium]
MTALLEQAIAEVSMLPQEEQEVFAAWILAELASERRWAQALAASEDALAALDDEALESCQAGQTYAQSQDHGFLIQLLKVE